MKKIRGEAIMNGGYKTIVDNVIHQKTRCPETQKVQDYLENLLQTVRIDNDELGARLEKLLSGSTDNVFRRVADTLVGLFGMRLVARGDGYALSRVSPGEENALLALDVARAKNAVIAILNLFDDAFDNVKRLQREREQMKTLIESASQSADKLRQERDEVRHRMEATEKKTLNAIQRILAQHPDMKPAGEDEQDALLLYFEDLGLTWSWDAGERPEDFTNYKISEASSAGVRLPCLYQNGAPALKGLRYYAEKASEQNSEA